MLQQILLIATSMRNKNGGRIVEIDTSVFNGRKILCRNQRQNAVIRRSGNEQGGNIQTDAKQRRLVAVVMRKHIP